MCARRKTASPRHLRSSRVGIISKDNRNRAGRGVAAPVVSSPPEVDPQVILDDLDQLLSVGNLDAAVQKATENNGVSAWVSSLAAGNPVKMRAAAVFAEIYFSYGEDSKARELLRPDRKSTRLNSSHIQKSRMPSSA